MKALVFGAGGLVGQEAVRAFVADGWLVAGPPHGAADIADAGSVRAAFDAAGGIPDAVVNCAAASNVDACERDEAAAWRANALGPRILAAECVRRGVPSFVHVSTDYVFDRADETPEEPIGAADGAEFVAPANAYGRTKLAGELAVVAEFRRAAPGVRHSLVRTSRLFGAGRDTIADVVVRMRAADPGAALRFHSGEAEAATSARWLARAIVALASGATSGERGGVEHVVCATAPDERSKTAYVRTVLKIAAELGVIPPEAAGNVAEVGDDGTAMRGERAFRPRGSVLLPTAAFSNPPDWKDEMRDCLAGKFRVGVASSRTHCSDGGGAMA